MEQRDSFVFYHTFKEIVDALPTSEPELRLKLYDAIVSHGLMGELDAFAQDPEGLKEIFSSILRG